MILDDSNTDETTATPVEPTTTPTEETTTETPVEPQA